VVRAALGGVAEAVGFGPELATNLQTAISEACNNIVLHAYGGQIGPMAVDINWNADQVDVVVADHGTGIQRVSAAAEHMGLGLALISALSSQAEFRSPKEGGTEVRMRFRRDQDASEAGIPRNGTWHAGYPGIEGDVVLWCQPVGVLRYVLGRLARALASRSHFTLKGAESLFAINDAIASYAEWAGDGHVTVAITAETRRLTFEGGPFLYDIDADRPPSPEAAETSEAAGTQETAEAAGTSGTPVTTEAAGISETSVSVEAAGASEAPVTAEAAETPETLEGEPKSPALRRRDLAELVDEVSFVRRDGHGRLHVLVRDSGRPGED
jgi:serine/threonine-protein kinase RsbW